MAELKKPKAGEYWIADDGSIGRIVGTKLNGDVIYELKNGNHYRCCGDDWEDWRHKPRCTGFAWVEPPAETYPKWYVHHDPVMRWYKKRLYSIAFVSYYFSGKEILAPWNDYETSFVRAGLWIEVTEAEAMARVAVPEPPAVNPGAGYELLPVGTLLLSGDQTQNIGKLLWVDTLRPGCIVGDTLSPGPYRRRVVAATVSVGNAPLDTFTIVPVESPDDWVEMTDTHPGHVRRMCDEVCGKTDEPDYWHAVTTNTYGFSQHAFPESRVRCRRKDLPDVYRWFIWADNRYPIAFRKSPDGDVMNLNVDGEFKTSDNWTGGYDDDVASGELKEVTESEAREYLRQPWTAPVKRVPLDLIAMRDNRVVWREHGSALARDERFVFSDGNGGFYVEKTE